MELCTNMPFKSFAQARFLFSKKPSVAKKFAEKTDFSAIPERVGRPNLSRRKHEWRFSSDGMLRL